MMTLMTSVTMRTCNLLSMKWIHLFSSWIMQKSETEQRQHKASFHVKKENAQEVMKTLSERLGKRGLDIKITYSGGMDLDILPKGAGKGQALAYLHKKLKEKGKLPKSTLACGDSGNDAELFTIPDVHGVMVKNAQEELLQWHAQNAKDNPKIIHATERCAAGIIEAIGHFKLGPNISSRDVADLSDAKLDHFDPAYEVVKIYVFFEKWRRAEVENPDVYLSNLKSVCSPSGVFVHPSGVQQSLHDCIDKLRNCCGDKKEKQYRVWVDQVFPSQIDSDTWLVKFQKWEQTGEEQQACLTTVVVSSKGVKPTEGLTWVHVHQTWMDGTKQNACNSWFF